MPNFTPEQTHAIEERGHNLLVSAAAGSGKTTVLIERVLSLVAEGTDIDRILIVTFTRAAAADMRAKLEKRLAARAGESERMRDQLDKLPTADIGTLHSFCAALMREQFEAAGVDPSFRIMEPAESERIAARVLREVMEEVYARGGEGLRALTCGRNPEKVAEIALQLHTFCRNRPDPDAWLREAVEKLDDEARVRDLYAQLEADARASVREAIAYMVSALALCEEEDGPAHYAACIEDDIAFLRGLPESGAPGRLYDALECYKPTRPGRGKCDMAILDKVKKLRDDATKRIQAALKTMSSWEAASRDMALLSPCLRTLAEIAGGLSARLDAEKDERSAYDYADLEHRAIRALREPAAAQAVRGKYEYVFVDEYQDISEAQEAVIRLVAKPERLFLVGDVKQSIYRFRQAEPGLFLQKSNDYRKGDGGQLIALNRNFRSREAILTFTNMVFSLSMQGDGSELTYDKSEYLIPGATFEGDDPLVEITLIDRDESAKGSETEDEDETIDAKAEGLWIANRIQTLHGTPLYDPALKAFRPTRYSDIVVLARTRSRILDIRDALDLRGVPCYADASGGLSESMEIRYALTLLRLTDNRRRDKELLGALLGPGMGFTPEDIAKIRIQCPKGAFLDAALSVAYPKDEQGNGGEETVDADSLRERLKRFFVMLERWRLLSGAMPADECITHILTETGFAAYVGFLPGGARRQANLELLLDIAAKYAATHGNGLNGFLASFREKRGSSDYAEASALGEGDDVVRLMTVHKSKGLEFPVVFGAQMERGFTQTPAGSEFRAEKQMGFGLEWHDPDLRTKRATLVCAAIDSKSRLETINEELRLLYVLMTRASDRLILVGSARRLEDTLSRWNTGEPGVRNLKCALDALAAATPGLSDEAPLTAPVKLVILPESNVRSAGRRNGVDETGKREPSPADRLTALLNDPAPADEEQLAAFRWVYPHAEETLSPVKLTVTGLTRKATGPAARETVAKAPKYLSGGRDALARGTAIHAALNAIDTEALRCLSGPALEAALHIQLTDLSERGVLPEGGADAESAAYIRRFLESDLGRRMLSATELHREWSFHMKAKAADIADIADVPGADASGNAEILIQGVIDCCFVENGGWILLDYKTDAANDEESVLRTYEPQIRLYARALRRITGMPVQEEYICLLRTNRALRIGTEATTG